MKCTEDYKTCTVHREWKAAHVLEENTRNELLKAKGIDIYAEHVDPSAGRLERDAFYARREACQLAVRCWCYEPLSAVRP